MSHITREILDGHRRRAESLATASGLPAMVEAVTQWLDASAAYAAQRPEDVRYAREHLEALLAFVEQRTNTTMTREVRQAVTAALDSVEHLSAVAARFQRPPDAEVH